MNFQKFSTLRVNAWQLDNHITVYNVSGSGRVYVAGGDKKICCVYTITANTWTQVTGPQMRHTYGAAVIHEERLVILGGDSDEVEEYDPELDTWDVAPYKLPRRLDFHYAFSMGVPK